MADKGIIFSAPMVRALLAGTKTQTRRLLKPVPEVFPVDDAGTLCDVGYLHVEGEDRPRLYTGQCLTRHKAAFAKGDRLYVREACAIDGPRTWYRLDHVEELARGPRVDVRWRPSIHMPRSASRMWLAVTDVRVERLQEITLTDICAEGLASSIYDFKPVQTGFDVWRQLWDSLHTAEGERWDDNPWIVAVSFDVHHGNIDAERV